MDRIKKELEIRFNRDNVPLSKELLAVIVTELVQKHCSNQHNISEKELNSVLKDIESRPIGVTENTVNACVMGGGAFGTAMACALARRGHSVTILMLEHEQKHVQNINNTHKNTLCFPNEVLPSNVRATIDPQQAMSGVGLVVHAVPVQFSRKYLQKMRNYIPKDCPIISISKGISMDTLNFMDDILLQEMGQTNPLAFIAGPSFAIGIIQGKPTWCTLAAGNMETAKSIQRLVSSSTFRTYCTTDVRGLEACSALKNVLSILCGMSLALGLGANTTNGLLTRAWADLRALVVGLGGRSGTLTGLCGIGDLMLTCYGGLSRNAKFGELLAQGNSVQDALKKAGGVVEGLPTSKAVQLLAAKLNIDVPVLNSIALLLEGKMSAKDLVTYVMALPLGEEFPNHPESNHVHSKL